MVSSYVVALCYGSALVIPLFLLWHFGVRHWLWHAASIVLALVIGLVPMPEALNGPWATLTVGWFFIGFFVWGAAAPLVWMLAHSPGLGHHTR